MAQIFGFSKTDVEKIKKVVRQVLGEYVNDPMKESSRNTGRARNFITGRLTSQLTAGATATLAVYLPDETGGLGDATGESYTIVDVDQLATSESPLAVNVRCTAGWCDGQWILIAYDCDLDTA